MVEVQVLENAEGRVLELRCSGHAEFSDEEHGGDIVCAAVSALTGMVGITLAEVLGCPQAVGAEDGHFLFQRPAGLSGSDERALDVLLEGLLRSLRGLEENYSGWVRVAQIANEESAL